MFRFSNLLILVSAFTLYGCLHVTAGASPPVFRLVTWHVSLLRHLLLAGGPYATINYPHGLLVLALHHLMPGWWQA